MRTTETKFSQEECLRRIHKFVEGIYGHLKKHASGNVLEKVEEDIEAFEDDENLKALLSKFDYASVYEFFKDAANLGELAKTRPDLIPVIDKKLQEIENLLSRMRKVEINEIKSARFLARTAHHLGNKVEGIDKGVEKSLKKIRKHAKSTNTNQQN